MKFFYSVMDWNFTLRQKCLKGEPVHFRQAAGLCERQTFLLKQG
ncbi:MAG: hypothetical protein WBW69_22315 [Candidatus Korobacteraceae bacterium]